MEIQAPSHWRCVEFISDLHLQETDQPTFKTWVDYMQSTQADALFILGDLFEVWVGDDAAQVADSFEADCTAVLRAASKRLALFIMRGNRDFLMGPAFMQACNANALPDPSVLTFASERWLLSHGDALCLDDQEYQIFRIEVQGAAWQEAFLAKPLDVRQRIARDIRRASASRKQESIVYADVDTDAALALLAQHDASHLIHGHTHRPAQHVLSKHGVRTVLSDWDMNATPPRAEVLRVLKTPDGAAALSRLPLSNGG